jgi:hypothetical protein
MPSVNLVGLKVSAQVGIREYKGKKHNRIDYFIPPIPRALADLLIANWLDWRERNPCPTEDGRHGWIFDAACACKRFKIPPIWAVRFIQLDLTRDEKRREVVHAVENAYDTDVKCVGPNGERLPDEDVEPFNPAALKLWADMVEEPITPEWLIERSPVSLDVDRDSIPALFLNSLFNQGEHVWCGRHDGDQGDFYTPGDDQCARSLWTYLDHSPRGGKFLINPTDGNGRSGPHITAFRYMMIESDVAPFDQWLRLLVQLRKPIVAIYESGRASIHALIRVDAATEFEFKVKGRELRELLLPLGADPKSTANKVVQLSRLPGIMRCETGKLQRLLWLDPLATGEPIYKRNNPGVASRVVREGRNYDTKLQHHAGCHPAQS